MYKLANEIKNKLESQKNCNLNWDQDDYMDLISMIADRKDYYVNLSFICDGANKKDQFKVWEIKNT